MHALFPTPGGGKTPLCCAEIQNTHTHKEPLTLNLLVFLSLSKFPSKNGHLEHTSSFFFLATFQMNSVPPSVDSLCNSWLHSAGEGSGPALGAKGIDNLLSKTESSKLSLLILFPGFISGWINSLFFNF